VYDVFVFCLHPLLLRIRSLLVAGAHLVQGAERDGRNSGKRAAFCLVGRQTCRLHPTPLRGERLLGVSLT